MRFGQRAVVTNEWMRGMRQKIVLVCIPGIAGYAHMHLWGFSTFGTVISACTLEVSFYYI